MGTNSKMILYKRPGHILWTSSAQVCLMFATCIGEICHVPQLYGSFFSFRLLRHHDRLLTRTNSSCLQFVHKCAVPTYRRKDKTDRGCVAFLFHIHPLTCSGFQVAHSVERTDLLLLAFCLSHALSSACFNRIAFFPSITFPFVLYESLRR